MCRDKPCMTGDNILKDKTTHRSCSGMHPSAVCRCYIFLQMAWHWGLMKLRGMSASLSMARCTRWGRALTN